MLNIEKHVKKNAEDTEKRKSVREAQKFIRSKKGKKKIST